MSDRIHIPSEQEMNDKIPLLRDMWDAILEDKWMWIVCWGQPRTSV
jgi:hypothetical protein